MYDLTPYKPYEESTELSLLGKDLLRDIAVWIRSQPPGLEWIETGFYNYKLPELDKNLIQEKLLKAGWAKVEIDSPEDWPFSITYVKLWFPK